MPDKRKLQNEHKLWRMHPRKIEEELNKIGNHHQAIVDQVNFEISQLPKNATPDDVKRDIKVFLASIPYKPNVAEVYRAMLKKHGDQYTEAQIRDFVYRKPDSLADRGDLTLSRDQRDRAFAVSLVKKDTQAIGSYSSKPFAFALHNSTHTLPGEYVGPDADEYPVLTDFNGREYNLEPPVDEKL